MNFLPVAQLFDSLLGEKPAPYNWREDPRARPIPEERENLSVHVDQCTIRQIEIKQMFARTRMDRYRDRQLLLAIIALLASNMTGIPEALSKFFP
jgi:hypothetical protein